MSHLLDFGFSPAAIPMVVAALAVFALGLFVLGSERASGVSLWFLALTLSVSWWLAAIAAAEACRDSSAAFFFARLAYLGIPLIPAAVLQFTTALLGVTRTYRGWLAVVWSGGGVFAALFTTTTLLLAGTWHYSWGFYPRFTAASSVFLVYFAAVLGSALVLLAKAQPQSSRELRRNRAFLVALAMGYAGSIDFLPTFGIAVFPLGCIAIVGFIVLSGRSVMRFRLTDLSPSSIADHLLRTMHGGTIVVDARGAVRIVNEAAAQLLGWSAGAVRQVDLRSLLDVPTLPMTDSDTFSRRLETCDRITRWKRADGSEVELQVSATAIRDDEEEIVGVLYALADVKDRRRADEHEYRATHDALTGLPNRLVFANSFEEQKEKIAASGRIPAVLFIDLDGFKAVNDQHGHHVGDALLKLVAKRIRHSIRGEDVLARYGGDEFVLLLDLARLDDAKLVGAKLLRVVSESYSIDEIRVTVGASIGAAFYPLDGQTSDELVRVADSAMYAAKRAGKGRLQVRSDVAGPPVFNIDARA